MEIKQYQDVDSKGVIFIPHTAAEITFASLLSNSSDASFLEVLAEFQQWLRLSDKAQCKDCIFLSRYLKNRQRFL